jgi:hypothetical protein
MVYSLAEPNLGQAEKAAARQDQTRQCGTRDAPGCWLPVGRRKEPLSRGQLSSGDDDKPLDACLMYEPIQSS